jgi:putative membrane protein
LGKLAKATSKNSAVLGFADHMITDHTKSEQKATGLAKKLSWTPQDSEKSKTIKADGDKTKTDLMSLKDPKAFDVAYMDAMVLAHQKVLKGIDEELIPSAKNEELKDMLKSKRDTVAMHLKHAQDVQGKL